MARVRPNAAGQLSASVARALEQAAPSFASSTITFNAHVKLPDDTNLIMGSDSDATLGYLASQDGVKLAIADNKAQALLVTEAANAYLTADTRNAAEEVLISKSVDFASQTATNTGNLASTTAAVMDVDYDAQTVMVAVSDNTPVATSIADSQFVGRPAGGNLGAMTAAQARTVLNVENGADVTDADNVAAAGAVMDSDFSGSATGVMKRTGVATYAVRKDNETTSDPTTSDNTAAGYETGSQWRNTQSSRIWRKVGETGGVAFWALESQFQIGANLNDNQGSAADVGSGTSWAAASYCGVILDYIVYRGTANVRVGELRIAIENNGTASGVIGDLNTENGTTGVTFSVVEASGSIKLQYTSTSTGTAPKFAYTIRHQFNVPQ